MILVRDVLSLWNPCSPYKTFELYFVILTNFQRLQNMLETLYDGARPIPHVFGKFHNKIIYLILRDSLSGEINF